MKTIIKKILGEQLTGTIDFYRDPKLRSGMGGPFNAQVFRQKIFAEIMQRIRFDAIVETGSYLGTTTEYMHEQSGLPIHTVEYVPRNFGFTRARFFRKPAVFPHLGDSRSFLRDLTQKPEMASKRLFCYLDAHWYDDLPLRDEVQIIYGTWQDAVIMVDDFKVPADEGYKYDDYGPDKSLTLDYLSPLRNLQMSAFFPSASAVNETGAKRGCVVLARDGAMISALRDTSSLTEHGPVI